MKKHLKVWKLIGESLRQNAAVMLLYVLQSSGSSPGRAGFCMAINVNGQMEGSIGGGIMEHKFVEMAKEKLQQNQNELSVRKQIHDKSAARHQSGMICSGEQTVLLYKVSTAELAAISRIIQSLEYDCCGALRLSPAGIHFLNTSDTHFTYNYQNNEHWQYTEPLGPRSQLYIFGAGHCSLSLSRLMRTLDFDIHLFDDRPHLNTFHDNSFAHHKMILQNYQQVAGLAIPPAAYVVLMTMGYRSDDLVLRTLMHQPFAYLGVLGSRKKIEKMFHAYTEEGIPGKILQRIYAPIGLPINSQTPEEIAISIAAQIIQVKKSNLAG